MSKYDINNLIGKMYKNTPSIGSAIQKIVNIHEINRAVQIERQIGKITNNPAIKQAEQIGSYIRKISNHPALEIAMKNIAAWEEQQQKYAPHLDKILDELQNNANYSEALVTIPVRQIFRLIVNSEKVEDMNLLNIINQDVFKRVLLRFFDEINLGSHFKSRKPLIEEAFQLYQLGLYAGCLCLLHSQFEGIITDYLIFKGVLVKKIVNSKTKFNKVLDGSNVTGLAVKIELAKNINESFKRLESFNFDNDKNIKFHNDRNDVLHGSNITNFSAERCFVVFIWIDSILGSIYAEEVVLRAHGIQTKSLLN
jgi:hypothetical protein